MYHTRRMIMPKSILGPNIRVGTHNGVMHADEVFCIATLKLINPNITVIRTRDPEILKSLEFRVDVGEKYDPDTGDFDHHQGGFDVRHPSPNPNKFEVGPKKAGFGLVWEHYGRQAIRAVLAEVFGTFDDDGVDLAHETITKSIVAPIDAHDNGENRTYYLNTGAYRIPSASSYIQSLNPTYAETLHGMTSEESMFNVGVNYAQNYLRREIIRGYSIHLGKGRILEQVKELPEHGVLILDTYIPWSPIFSRHAEETKHVKMVVFPSSADDSWMFQSPYFNYRVDSAMYSSTMPDGSRRRLRHPTPEHLYGKNGKELQEITGVADAIFILHNGFIGAAQSKEGAVALCEYIITHQS